MWEIAASRASRGKQLGKRERKCPAGYSDHSAEHSSDLLASTFTHEGLWKQANVTDADEL